ncbi:T9SS type A sorting domain-containing protein [Winogradskyella schleiferi]|uniref:T9SS type A sorting domain-containing protein n=1 Tax=Winogradskyella schleiferi TaxID=2686078 RepID=UPI0015BBB86D|nr:T9SS type A sorting domain-containing protein [Winogradskyella schleiferi]
MKTNYTLKMALLLLIATFCFSNLTAQVRILRLDPATNSVTLKNFGSSNVPISGYWFCNFPMYAQVSDMTSTASLDPGEEVNIGSTINFAVADGEFGLYTTNSEGFGSSNAMIDYLQWGSAGHQRESTAVGAGVWDAGSFVNVSPPFEYNGDGTQNGAAFWVTLGVDDFETISQIELFPNPTSTTLNIIINRSAINGTIGIYDILGKEVISQSINSSDALQLDVSNLISGMYLIKIATENSVETKRFIKN